MKNKSRLSERSAVHQDVPLENPPLKTKDFPDPPLHQADLPDNLPEIGQSELLACANAHSMYLVARADYERKRAALTLKLLQLGQVQEGGFWAELDHEGNLILMESCDCCNTTKRVVEGVDPKRRILS